MGFARFQPAVFLVALLLAGAVTQPAQAQRGAGQGRGKGSPRGNTAARPRDNAGKQTPRPMLGVPPPWLERLQEMSPEEQERFLNNNERFKSLLPERQANIRERLRQWNALTPQQRAAVRERQGVWQQMTPEQRRYVREELLPKWQLLPPDRRQALLRRLHTLHNLSEAERDAKLNDETFMEGLSPEDRIMLRELARLRVGSAPQVPQDNP